MAIGDLRCRFHLFSDFLECFINDDRLRTTRIITILTCYEKRFPGIVIVKSYLEDVESVPEIPFALVTHITHKLFFRDEISRYCAGIDLRYGVLHLIEGSPIMLLFLHASRFH